MTSLHVKLQHVLKHVQILTTVSAAVDTVRIVLKGIMTYMYT